MEERLPEALTELDAAARYEIDYAERRRGLNKDEATAFENAEEALGNLLGFHT